MIESITKDPLHDKNGIIEKVDIATGKVIFSLTLEDAVEIMGSSAVTFRYEEIDTISMWLPKLYALNRAK